jgi:mycothiol synthase
LVTLRSLKNEQEKMQMLSLAKQYAEENLHVGDLLYRLGSWALDDPANVALWFDQDELVAWAVLQTPWWTIDYVCAPDYISRLHREIIAWADERAKAALDTPYGHPVWFIMAFSGQSERIRDLEGAGYACQADVGEDSWSKVLLCRSVQTPVRDIQPPDGFTVRPLAGEAEVEKYVELHQAVFESKNMTVDWRRRTLKFPGYLPELDLIVEAPDGRLGAFCICWFDKERKTGHVEPLGSLQEFRRYALGLVALSQGLRRLQAMGAEKIYVETDDYRDTAFRLYQSFGFEVIQKVLVFRKEFA